MGNMITQNITPFSILWNNVRKEILKFIVSLDSSSNLQSIPKTSGVYFLWDSERDEVIYVGQSIDMHKRWKTHRFARDLKQRYHNCKIYYYKVDVHLLSVIENYFILALLPLFNENAGTSIVLARLDISQTNSEEIKIW